MQIESGEAKGWAEYFKAEWKTILLILLVSGMVMVDFARNGEGFQFGTNTLIALSILVLLVLAKSFDKLAVGKWLVVEGNLKKAEQRKEKAEARNDELIKNFVTFSANLNLANMNKIDLNFPAEFLSKVGVTKANDEDLAREQAEEAPEKTSVAEVAGSVQGRFALPHIMSLRRGLSHLAIDRYASDHQLDSSDITREVRFTKALQSLDPIMERSVLFDGYLESAKQEVFFEARPERTLHFMYANRLYVTLTKLFFYSRAKKVETKLVLIQYVTPDDGDEMDEPFIRQNDRFKSMFSPAIDNGMLEIYKVELTEADTKAAEERASQVREQRSER